MIIREIAEKLSDNSSLFVSQITDIIEFMNIAKVSEHLIGIGHILVYIIEVGKQQLSPSVKMVERLFDSCTLDKRLMKVAYQFYGIGNFELSVRTEQVADGDIDRTPYRTSCQFRQVFVDEQRGTLVGKYNSGTRQVMSVFADNIFGYIF